MSPAWAPAAPPDPHAEENQTNDQDDRADEQQEQQSFYDRTAYPQRDRRNDQQQDSAISGSPISRMSSARTC